MPKSPLETFFNRDNNAIHFIHIFPGEFTFCAPEYPANKLSTIPSSQKNLSLTLSAEIHSSVNSLWTGVQFE